MPSKLKNVKLTVVRPLVSVDIQFKRGVADKDLAFHRAMHDFLRWTLDNNVLPAASGHSGPLGFRHSYYSKDAKKVLAWWKERGVE